jgi:hypothetical protein
MHCVKLLRQRLMARDFDRELAELQVRLAVLNGDTAPGIPVTRAVAHDCPGQGSLGHHTICATEPVANDPGMKVGSGGGRGPI